MICCLHVTFPSLCLIDLRLCLSSKTLLPVLCTALVNAQSFSTQSSSRNSPVSCLVWWKCLENKFRWNSGEFLWYFEEKTPLSALKNPNVFLASTHRKNKKFLFGRVDKIRRNSWKSYPQFLWTFYTMEKPVFLVWLWFTWRKSMIMENLCVWKKPNFSWILHVLKWHYLVVIWRVW